MADILKSIFAFLILILGIFSSISAILLYRIKSNLAREQEELTREKKELTREKQELIKIKKKYEQKTANNFTELVDRLDRKVSAFANYFIRSPQFQSRNQYEILGTPISKTTNSLFNLRLNHFHEEKYKICKRAIEHILKENERALKANKIILLIDSGSTVYPIFHLLTKLYSDENYIESLKKMVIFTNNIPGIVHMINEGRKGTSYDAEMMIKCNVIPGMAEGKYGAILGEDSGSHLEYFLNSNFRDSGADNLIISLVTGNYISLKDGILWRGDYHGKLKNSLVKLSDVIYIVAPLGKIFKVSKDHINELIRSSNVILPPSKWYKDLLDSEAMISSSNNNNENTRQIKMLLPKEYVQNKEVFLVTTQRPPKRHDRIEYPPKLNTYFSKVYGGIKDCFEQQLISVNFEPWNESAQTINDLLLFKDSVQAFLNYEFPHPEVREAMREKLEL